MCHLRITQRRGQTFVYIFFFAVCIPAFDVISRVHKGFRSPLVQLPIAVSRLMIDVVPHDKN